MPQFKVYAKRITDIETVVEAADPDEAAEIANEIDPTDRQWEDSGNSVLDDISPVNDVTPLN
jgi:hypothetical protein